MVNVSSQEQATDIKLGGAKITGPASAVVLASEKPTDENSLAEPTKVAPVARTIDVQAGGIRHVFPGNSLTVIRVKVGQ